MITFNEVGRQSEPEKVDKSSYQRGKLIAVIIGVVMIGTLLCHVFHLRTSDHLLLVDLKPGMFCKVQFRRDALGSATTAIPPTTDNYNGAILSLYGELVAVRHNAILLDQVNENYIVNDVPQMRRFWIPKDSILLIEYEPARTFLDLPQDNILRIQYEVQARLKTTETQ